MPENYKDFEAMMDSIEGNGPQTTLFALLTELGIALPPPEEVAEADLYEVLWEVINGMAELGAYLSSTNHLSDRELYALLWHDTLRADHPIVPEDWPMMTDIDILGGWSNEDIHNFLKYYADEEERRRFAAQGGDPIPDHVDPSYSRDHLLP